MSARPWGRTGRVTIDGDVGDPRALPNVYVEGEWVGWLYTPDDKHPKWGARGCGPSYENRDDIPTLDAAVMWVLRRAAPKVWREERGPVWQVARCGGPEFIGGPGWDAWLPSTGKFGHHKTHADAIKAATS